MALGRTIAVNIVGNAAGLEAAFAKSAAATQGFAGKMQAASARTVAAGRKMTMGMTLPLAAVGVVSVKMSNEYEKSMSRVVGLAGKSEKQVKGWSDAILKASPNLGKGPRELGEALYFVASSGVPASKTMSVLSASAKASTAGLGETAVVADAVTSAMNAYASSNLSAEEATNILVATVREGKGEAQEFAPIIGNVVAYASKMGVAFNEVGASLAAMTQLGTKPAQAGVQLQAFFSSMLRPSAASEKAAQKVGLSFDKLRGDLAKPGGLRKVLDDIKVAFDGDAKGMAEMFPRVEGLRALLALAAQDGGRVSQVFKQLGDNTGDLDRAFKAAQERQGFSIDKMKSALESLGISIGTILMPFVSQLSIALGRLAVWFSNLSPHTQKMIVMIAGIAAAAGPVLMILGSIAGAVAALASPIALLVAGVVLLVGAMVAAKVAPEQFSQMLQKLGMSADQANSLVKGLAVAFDYLAPVAKQIAANVMTMANIMIDALQLVANVVRGDFGGAWRELKSLMGRWLGGIVDSIKVILGPIIPLMKTLAAKAALAFLEPFSHLPGKAGKWARDAKDSVEKWMDPKGWKLKKQMEKVGGDAMDGLKGALKAKKITPAQLKAYSPAIAQYMEKEGKQAGEKAKAGAGKVASALRSKNPEVRAAAQGVAKQLLAMASGIDGLSAIIGAKVAAEIQAGLQAGVTGAGKATKGSGPFQFTRHVVAAPMVTGMTDLKSQNLSGKLTTNMTAETTKGVGAAAENSVAAAAAAGKKVTDSLLRAYLAGTASLPEGLSQRMTAAIDRAKAAVDAGRSKLSDAWSRLAGDAMTAFDAKTSTQLEAIQRRLVAKVAQIDRVLQKTLTRIDEKREKKTPAEKALEALDKAEGIKQREDALRDAAEQERAARAGEGFEAAEDETPEEAAERVKRQQEAIDAAVEAGRQARLAIQRAELSEQAEKERTAADEAARKATEFQTKKAEGKKKAAEKAAAEETKQKQAERDLEKRHLEDWLEGRRIFLEKHPEQWRKVHQQILKKFGDEFGPNMRTAGRNLGAAFVTGLRESFSAMDSTAQELARLIAKYLKSNSPPEAGPLSDIDKWGDDLIVGQFVGGIDLAKVEASMEPVGLAVARGFWKGIDTGNFEGSKAMAGAGLEWDPVTGQLVPKSRPGSKSTAKAGGKTSGEKAGEEAEKKIPEPEEPKGLKELDMGALGGKAEPMTEEAKGRGLPKPTWADQEIWDAAVGFAIKENQVDEFEKAIQSGQFKSNGGLLDQLFRRRTRWNWNDWPTRLLSMFEMMKPPEGLSGKEVAAYYGLLAKGGIVTRRGFATVGEKGPEAILPLTGLAGRRALGGFASMGRGMSGYSMGGSRDDAPGGGGGRYVSNVNIEFRGSTLYGGDRRKMADELAVDIEAALRRKEIATGKQLFVT